MAKIPYLHGRPLADGRTAWNFKPSPRLREAGWTNQQLGETEGKQPSLAIIEKAMELGRQVDSWNLGFAAAAAAAPAVPIPSKWLFCDLVTAYKASDAYKVDIAAATRREYGSRIRQLEFWAQDGQLPIRDIDLQMVRDLKAELLKPGEDGAAASKFKCAAMLRVLRLLLRWAKNEGLLALDPTAGVPIPATPARKSMLTWRDVQDIATLVDAGAVEDADPLGVRALRFGFWSMQRRADLVQFNRFAWRELHGADPRDLPALVNAKGQVWGFRITQQKTGATVDCPMPPFLHAEIEEAFAQSQWLFPHSLDATKAMSGDVIRRRVKPLLVAGGFPTLQLRDMRRSGMSWVKDMGAEKSDVFAISGHPLDGQQKTMADVYMPPNTKAACRAIAAACRTLAAIEAREKEDADNG